MASLHRMAASFDSLDPFGNESPDPGSMMPPSDDALDDDSVAALMRAVSVAAAPPRPRSAPPRHSTALLAPASTAAVTAAVPAQRARRAPPPDPYALAASIVGEDNLLRRGPVCGSNCGRLGGSAGGGGRSGDTGEGLEEAAGLAEALGGGCSALLSVASAASAELGMRVANLMTAVARAEGA